MEDHVLTRHRSRLEEAASVCSASKGRREGEGEKVGSRRQEPSPPDIGVHILFSTFSIPYFLVLFVVL